MKEKDGRVLLSRRQVIKLGTAGGAGFFLSTKLGALPKLFAQAIPDAAILDPALIPKYVTPLVIPPAMPRADKVRPGALGKFADYYEIAVREFSQQILPAVNELGQSTGFGSTRVWSYCSAGAPQPLDDGGTLHYPSLTIEAKYTRPSVIRWMNQLVDEAGSYLPHLLPVDQTLHWANPPGPRDGHGHDPQPYKGPVPIVIHVHGAHTADHSDGYPEAWFLPAAANLPDGIATTGTHYDIFKRKSPLGLLWRPGSAVFAYPNDQRATTLWYHDHSLGMTRVNVYAGPAGFYIIRGGPGDAVLDSATGRSAELPGPAPALGDRPGTKYYEIPLAIQDRSFKSDGSLFYPDNRAFFEGLEPNQLDIPFMGHGGMHTSDVPPIWNPEFFGNAMVVNGYTWPHLDVEQRRYRFRLLNGCDSRFLILEFGDPTVDVWQIGSDQGYLGAPFHVTNAQSTSPLNNRLLIAPAERADVIVDFTNVPVGAKVRLLNIAPDEPFGGFDPEGPVADPETTGQVMEFRVGPIVGEDTTTPPERLLLPALPAQAPMAQTRQLSLNELMSMHIKVPFDLAADAPVLLAFDPATNMLVTDDGGGFVIYDEAVHSSYIGKLVSLTPEMEAQLPAGVTAEMFGPVAAFMGTMDADGQPVPKPWADPVTETPARNTSEVWEFHNFTADAHPIHVHLVQFQVLGREPMGDPGAARGPEGWETGMKDTVISYPGEITRIQATFDLAGRYVWHCHIVEHEDNEMMRPFRVL